MTAGEAALLVSELEEAVRTHFPGEGLYLHLLSELRVDLERLAVEQAGGEGLVLGNVETGHVGFVYGRNWFKEVEWMDDMDRKPVVDDGRKEGDREGR